MKKMRNIPVGKMRKALKDKLKVVSILTNAEVRSKYHEIFVL